MLRVLAFSKTTTSDAVADYPSHKRWASLNDRKYVALELHPITTRASLERAFLAVMNSSIERMHAARMRGWLIPASPTPTPTANAIAHGDKACPRLIMRLAARTRGLYAALHAATETHCERGLTEHHLNRLLKRSGTNTGLQRMLDAWETSMRTEARNVAVEAAALDESLVTWRMPLEPGELHGPWYDLADDGVVKFHDADMDRAVSFLHPSDVPTLLMHFRRDRTVVGGLTAAEEVSLLAPHLASADELNEPLVFESLVWKSCQLEGLTVAPGVIVRNLRTKVPPEPIYVGVGERGSDNGDAKVSTAALAKPSALGCIFKEYPDEHGGDGVALCRLSDDVPNEYVLLRVQVKMSGEDKSTRVSEKMMTKWLTKLTNSSTAMVNDLRERLSADVHGGTPVTIRAMHILWIAQSCSDEVRALATNSTTNVLFIGRHNMLSHWTPRVHAFVETRGLTCYGGAPLPPPRFVPPTGTRGAHM
ncbi:MAG: hypothetical protein EOO65_04295 [Methanosarcinales archaeon]|nr:MAG: hypothetical protein EOO65_04295 [Methanosarcinales archaeon]